MTITLAWEFGVLGPVIDPQNGLWHECKWRPTNGPSEAVGAHRRDWTSDDFAERSKSWPYAHSKALRAAHWTKLGELGAAGWEVVAVTGTFGDVYHLKRPV